jgi:hypothetical protein
MTVAGVFGLPHLSEDAVAAFADGVLSASAAARAQRHCAECAECAEAVRAQRETALLLRAAGNPTAPAELMSRLAGLPMSAPLPPPCGGLPTVLGADGVPMFIAHDPRNANRMSADAHPMASRTTAAQLGHPRPDSGQSHGHRRVLLAGGILASAAAVVAAGAIGSNLTSLPRPVQHQPASVQLPVSLTSASTGGGASRRSGSPAIPSAALPGAGRSIAPSLLPVRSVLATSPHQGAR